MFNEKKKIWQRNLEGLKMKSDLSDVLSNCDKQILDSMTTAEIVVLRERFENVLINLNNILKSLGEAQSEIIDEFTSEQFFNRDADNPAKYASDYEKITALANAFNDIQLGSTQNCKDKIEEMNTYLKGRNNEQENQI